MVRAPDAGGVTCYWFMIDLDGRRIAMKRHLPAILLTILLARAAPDARAAPGPGGRVDPLRPVAYALVVGSNLGGPGQGELRYAEQDARRVNEVLIELGGYDRNRVELLAQPGRDQLVQALARTAERLEQHVARGEKTLFLFYYSGHARSAGLNLGRETLPLPELREKLMLLPATVVLAVLDACQSGAFSRVKGAELTADFSFNSVTQLSTAGIAVMASSGASELSQESDRLQSSYFTHHLLAALRGVADLDRDGHVTLAEAYRYSYNRTLVDTSGTSVGGQHVTLETGLRGKGEVVLSYPAAASAQLDLPVPLRGELLIERRPSGSVIAELHKAAGEPMRLALAPGEYRAVWRKDGEARECRLVLRDSQVTSVDTSACSLIAEPSVALKGASARSSPWALELSMGTAVSDGYRPTFTNRGFDDANPYDQLAFNVSGIRTLTSNLELLLDLRQLDTKSYLRVFEEGERQRLSWRVFGASAQLRAVARLWDGRLNLYIQGGLGLTLGRTRFVTGLDESGRRGEGSRVAHTWFPGFFGTVANGVLVAFGPRLGAFFQLRYSEVNDLERYDPAVHQGGHVTDTMVGLRLGLGGNKR